MISINAFILAVALVETGNDPAKVGAAGERSEYQISKAVWHKYTRKPFSAANARNRKLTSAIARSHANYLHTIYPSVPHMAVMWNAGPGYMTERDWKLSKCNRNILSYARCVQNTYEQLRKEGK